MKKLVYAFLLGSLQIGCAQSNSTLENKASLESKMVKQDLKISRLVLQTNDNKFVETPLHDGVMIKQSQINIEAVVEASAELQERQPIVKFFVNKQERALEESAPYELFGDDENGLKFGSFEDGLHEIAAVPMVEDNGRLLAGTPYTVHIQVEKIADALPAMDLTQNVIPTFNVAGLTFAKPYSLSVTAPKVVYITNLTPIASTPTSNMNGRHYYIKEDKAGQDLVIHLPKDKPATLGIRTEGFRNIRIIGGFIQPREGTSALKFDGLSADSNVHVEGLRIDLSLTPGKPGWGKGADAINVASKAGVIANIVTIMNVNVTNVVGRGEFWHGDAFQVVSGKIKLLRVYNFTATGNYQIFHVASASTSVRKATYTRVNAKYNGVQGDIERPWLFMFKSVCKENFAQHTLTDVWMQPRTDKGFSVGRHHVHPDSRDPDCGAIIAADGSVTFRPQKYGTNVTPVSELGGVAANIMVRGKIRSGTPPEDFAPAWAVGLNYPRPL